MPVKKSVTTTARVLRAVLAEWAERLWRTVAGVSWTVGLGLMVGFGLLAWYHHPLWLILCAAATSTTAILTIVLLAARAVIRLTNSTETPAQQQLANAIVDQLVAVAEAKGTPRVLLAARLTFDVATRRTAYLRQLLSAAVGTKDNIIELGRLFGGEVPITLEGQPPVAPDDQP